MPKNGTFNESNSFEVQLSRRAFTGAIGGTALFGAAADSATAEDLRDEEMVTAEEINEIAPIADDWTPEEWWTIGPFQDMGDPTVAWLSPEGSANDFGTGEQTPDQNQRLQSAFAAGSTVTWEETTIDEDDPHIVPMGFGDRVSPTVDDPLDPGDENGVWPPAEFQSQYGSEIDNPVGYGFSTFELDEPRRAVLHTSGSPVWLNGQRYDREPMGVILQEGVNFLLIQDSLSSDGTGSIRCRFRPSRAPVEVEPLRWFRNLARNAVVPDLIVGEKINKPASVRVTNYTAQRIKNATLTIAADHEYIQERTVEIEPALAPFETRRINTVIESDGPVPTAGDGTRNDPEDTSFTATVAVGEQEDSRDISLVVLGPDWIQGIGNDHIKGDGKRVTTFESKIDESVQYLGYRPPGNFEESNGPYQLVVTLHGAGVNARNMSTGSYRNRDDVFIMAPDTRGPSSYNHEHTGRLDDLEALEKMKEWFDIDENKISLTGHSMGGHGASFVGLTHPDKWAAVGPSAGWVDRRTYTVKTHRRDVFYSSGPMQEIKDRVYQKSKTMQLTENAADGTLPFFIMHGSEDESVPNLHSRWLARSLSYRGLTTQGEFDYRHSTPDPDVVDVAYLEVPGASHWWNKDIGPGADIINHPDLIDNFLLTAERDPYPEHVHFYTTNLRIENEKFWVEIDEQRTIHTPTRVDAKVVEDGLSLQTENVAVMSIDPRVFEHTSIKQTGQPTLHVDGESVTLPGRGGKKRIWIDFRDGLDVSRNEPTSNGLRKTSKQYGPMKEIYYSPYRLVYGTQGDDQETALNRSLANQVSHVLCDENGARSPAIVVRDTDVDKQIKNEYNLILFGRPSSNSVLESIQGDHPIQVGDDWATVDDQTYHGDLAVRYIYPNPEAPDRLVQVNTGTSISGVRLTNVPWGSAPDRGQDPDYQVYDDTVETEAWNGVLAAGFFDKEWELSDELSEIRRLY